MNRNLPNETNGRAKRSGFLLAFAAALVFGVLACGGKTPSSADAGPASAGTSGGSGGGSTGTTGSTGSSTGGSTGRSTGGTSGTTGQDAGPPPTCDPNASVDPCKPYGLACSADQFGSGSCALPGEFSSCLPNVGCAAPYQCLSDAAGHSCYQTCTGTAGCLDPLTKCTDIDGGQRVCDTILCGPGSGPDGGDGAPFYATCDSSTAGDGLCIPYLPRPDGGAFGICYQEGSVPTDGTCYGVGTRLDGGTSFNCAMGDFCMPYRSRSVCQQMCATGVSGLDGGPSCPSGLTCVDLGTFGIDFGLCAHTCSQTSTSCPAGTTCGQLTQTVYICGPN